MKTRTYTIKFKDGQNHSERLDSCKDLIRELTSKESINFIGLLYSEEGLAAALSSLEKVEISDITFLARELDNLSQRIVDITTESGDTNRMFRLVKEREDDQSAATQLCIRIFKKEPGITARLLRFWYKLKFLIFA